MTHTQVSPLGRGGHNYRRVGSNGGLHKRGVDAQGGRWTGISDWSGVGRGGRNSTALRVRVRVVTAPARPFVAIVATVIIIRNRQREQQVRELRSNQVGGAGQQGRVVPREPSQRRVQRRRFIRAATTITAAFAQVGGGRANRLGFGVGVG